MSQFSTEIQCTLALRFGIEICFVFVKLFRFGVQAVTVEPTVDGLAAVTSLLIQFPGLYLCVHSFQVNIKL